jgi:FkbM family methyltransferase
MDKVIESFHQFCDYRETYSQSKQDLLALFCLGESPKYFVEFGACDGVYLSNTFMLEKYYKWDGLLVEPSEHYFKVLSQVRSSKVDNSCISDTSGLLIEFLDIDNLHGLSGIDRYAHDDNHSDLRKLFGNRYLVETLSLNDLLDKHNCPNHIDYISIDTEGSEYIILNSYDFSRTFDLITVEHNNTYQEGLINDLLSGKGYVQIMPEESKWDSWFVSQKIYESLVNKGENK